MAEKKCPNCPHKERRTILHSFVIEPEDVGGTRGVCAYCGLPVKLWPKWRKMKEVCEIATDIKPYEGVMDKARRALGRRR